MAGDHLWSPTSVSVDFCYVGDSDCVVSDGRLINPFVIEGGTDGGQGGGTIMSLCRAFWLTWTFFVLSVNQFPGD